MIEIENKAITPADAKLGVGAIQTKRLRERAETRRADAERTLGILRRSLRRATTDDERGYLRTRIAAEEAALASVESFITRLPE